MDGYISSRNNSCLFAGNRRVTWLLVEAVIATVAEQAKKKKAPLKEAKNFTNWKQHYSLAHTTWLRANLWKVRHTQKKKKKKKETSTSNEDENAEENTILHNRENR